MRGLIHILISAVAVFVTAYLLPGVHVASFWTALVIAVILGLVNFLVKPLIVILTLPVTIVTLGLFLFVINAAIILLVAWIVPGFRVDGFLWALLYSIVLSLISGVLHEVTA
jgi:putative membrane protein